MKKIKIETINFIRNAYFIQELSIKEIKDTVKLSNNTIKNIIENKITSFNSDEKEFNTIDNFKTDIEKMFIENKKSETIQNSSQLYDKFLETHPDCTIKKHAYTAYISYLKKINFGGLKVNYVPISHKDFECQVDFAYCQYSHNGKLFKGNFLIVAFPKSNACYCQLLRQKSLQNFIHCTTNIFKHINCVPKEIWFDNDSIFIFRKKLVKKIYKPFIEFSKFYNFRYVFCKIKSPNQKGYVEKNVKFIRDNIFIPAPVINNIDVFNNDILKICDSLHFRKNRNTNTFIYLAFNKNKLSFNSLPNDEFENKIIKTFTLDIFARFLFENNYYYLPINLVYPSGKSFAKYNINCIIYYDRIYAFDKSENLIDIFYRITSIDNSKQYLKTDWGNYLPVLAKNYNFLFSLPFYRTLPMIIQDHILFLNPIELSDLLMNMHYIYKKYDYSICIKTASICIIKKDTSKHNFYIISNRLKKNPYYNPKC